MSRAILFAPVAMNLRALYAGNVVRIEGATNGVKQAWDTMDREFYEELADPAIEIRTRRQDLPRSILPYLVLVLRSDSISASVNPEYKRMADCGAGDFFRVQDSGNVVRVRSGTTVLNSDTPLDRAPAHEWQGVVDTMGIGKRRVRLHSGRRAWNRKPTGGPWR